MSRTPREELLGGVVAVHAAGVERTPGPGARRLPGPRPRRLPPVEAGPGVRPAAEAERVRRAAGERQLPAGRGRPVDGHRPAVGVGAAPPVDEWRFHDFGIAFAVGDVNGWWSRIDKEAAWAVAHGANMVLGAWGFNAWDEPVADVQEHMKQAIGRIISDKRINGAVYWSYQPWIHSRWYLANADGSLTAAGQTYVNPLTDIPTDVQIVASGNGQAELRWSNTTSAWAAEAEFWVQASGSNSFVYHNTELLAGPGATQTGSVVFSGGDSVKGRVRYYNAYGQAEWSPFSNIVAMASPAPAKPDPGKAPGRSRLFCFFKLCQ